MNDLSVCITSFMRPRHLEEAISSCKRNHIKNINVFAMRPYPILLLNISDQDVRLSSLTVDLGCHELWLQAAYRSTTPRLIILHDDDTLAPEFAGTYESIIKPVLDSKETGFASWRGHVRNEKGKIRSCEYFVAQTGVYPSETIREIVSRKEQFSLSPVISIFDRTVLIHALKESANALPYLRPGMPLGTEIVAYMRHCEAYPKWLHVHRVLSYYGSHPGSGTVQAETNGTAKLLTQGYDVARTYCLKNKPPKQYEPRLLLTYWPGLNNERIANARKTWDFQFNLGRMLDFPMLSQTTPKLHALMDYACSMAMPEDIIVYANLDLAFTIDLPDRIMACIRKSHGVCVAWRRTMEYNPDQHFLSVRQGVRDGGVDLIACTTAWWLAHRSKIPDVYVASNFWDYIFRKYCEYVTNGECYIEDGTYHWPHESFMDRVKLTTPEQKWNLAKAKTFFASIGQRHVVQQLERDTARIS